MSERSSIAQSGVAQDGSARHRTAHGGSSRQLAREVRLLRRRTRQTVHELREGLAQQLTGVSLMAKALELDLRGARAQQTPLANDLSRLTTQAVHQCLQLAEQIKASLPGGDHSPQRRRHAKGR